MISLGLAGDRGFFTLRDGSAMGAPPAEPHESRPCGPSVPAAALKHDVSARIAMFDAKDTPAAGLSRSDDVVYILSALLASFFVAAPLAPRPL